MAFAVSLSQSVMSDNYPLVVNFMPVLLLIWVNGGLHLSRIWYDPLTAQWEVTDRSCNRGIPKGNHLLPHATLKVKAEF